MNVVGKVGSLISQGVYSVATPFHPFGGAVDVIVVQQEDGTYRSTPWYVRFGKFQGVLKGAEKIVSISVNGVEAPFHMYLDNSGQAYFMREVVNGSEPINPNEDESASIRTDSIQEEEIEYDEEVESNGSDRPVSPGYKYSSLEEVEELVKESNGSNSEVILVSIDGHVLTAPIRSTEENSTENLDFIHPQFHLGPGESTSGDFGGNSDVWETGFLGDLVVKENHREVVIDEEDTGEKKSLNEVEKFRSCLDLTDQIEEVRESLVLESRNGSEVKEERESLISESQNDSEVREERESLISESQNDSEVKGERESLISESQNDSEVKEERESLISEPQNDSEVKGERESLIRESQNDSEVKEEREIEVKEENDEFIEVESLENKLEGEATEEDAESSEKKLEGEETGENAESPEKKLEVDETGEEKKIISGCEISICGNLLKPGMGRESAEEIFKSHQISEEEFKQSGPSILKNTNLIIKIKNNYFPYSKAAHLILGRAVFGPNFPLDSKDSITIEEDNKDSDSNNNKGIIGLSPSPSRRWRLWPIPFRMSRTIQRTNSTDSSTDELFLDSEPFLNSPTNSDIASEAGTGSVSSKISSANNNGTNSSPRKQFVRANLPTNEQIAALNLIEGQNIVTFSFTTRVFGKQQVDAHIYLWKWNARIVISDVDGTITKSDVLGQFMPLVGKDWTQSGVARLFCAIKENGYQLLFLSARAIVQAYLTRNFLNNLKQDGKALPTGPVVISPDGLFPSLYREVIRRAPHEFKIACLEDIKALFPSDYNPFYAGFGNRDTDELSYRKIGIPKGKIFIINPKGEVAINNCTDVKSYTSLHTLVNDMFPPTSLVEQEDFNAWNYWKMPLPSID